MATSSGSEKSDARTGRQTVAEQLMDRYVGNGIHLFLSLLAILILAAALIATVGLVIRDFPTLWRQA